MNRTSFKIFKAGSRTYFYSSIFFPEPLRSDVFTLYSFVRKADDYVDMIPQDTEGFKRLCESYRQSLNGKPCGDPVIDNFVELKKRREFPDEWIDAFLNSMAMDLKKSEYNSIDETLEYMYGSAEVIGLFMSKLMELPEESYEAAKHLGRAMQYINFIRDIDEDNGLGRQYLPLQDTYLKNLLPDSALEDSEEFISFIKTQIELYHEWQKKAETGYSFIPRRYLIPIKTAADMYLWTSLKIYNDPQVVYRRKMKPPVHHILFTIIKNSIMLKRRSK